MKPKSAAILTVHDPANFSPKGRKAIAKWLQKQAKTILKYSPKLAKRYTARYLYA